MTTPIAQGPVDVNVMPLNEQVTRLRAGNTALLEALMDMVDQFFYSDYSGVFLSHSYMSAEEGAISVLIQAGMAEEVSGKGYRLLWDKLEERKPKQQTWEEAVRECVTDPAEVERLLALNDNATADEVHAAVKGHNVDFSGSTPLHGGESAGK